MKTVDIHLEFRKYQIKRILATTRLQFATKCMLEESALLAISERDTKTVRASLLRWLTPRNDSLTAAKTVTAILDIYSAAMCSSNRHKINDATRNNHHTLSFEFAAIVEKIALIILWDHITREVN